MNFADALGNFRADDSRRFLLAWDRWRGTNLLPRRGDVALADIKKLLPRVMVFEVRDAEHIVFRLAGSVIGERLGFDPTGLNHLDLAPTEGRAIRAAQLLAEVRQPCAAVMLYPVVYASGRRVPAEVVSAPVEPDRQGEPIQVIALATELADSALETPANGARLIAAGEGLAFIDIGAGVPPLSPRPEAAGG